MNQKKLESFLRQLLQHLGYQADEFKLEFNEDEQLLWVIITVETDNPGVIIGRGGEVILAMEKVLRSIFSEDESGVRVRVDINRYRAQRREKIIQFIDRLACEVSETNPEVMVKKPLSSYERFIAHQYITQHLPHLTSLSVGEDRERRLVIKLK